jgi:methylenetetrahydrofolate reductase (NADPH)
MSHGPCGGVQADGACEVGGPCAYVVPAADAIGGAAVGRPDHAAGGDGQGAWVAADHARTAWATAGQLQRRIGAPAGSGDAAERELDPASAAILEQLTAHGSRPFVVADLPSPGVGAGPDARRGAGAAEEDRRLAAGLAGSVDGVLLGDAPWARVQLPPAVRGANVAREGVIPMCGINGRDRNRAALESELAGLTALGVPAVHCVTGDHPSLGHRPDAAPVFDLDSTQLTALAIRATPLLVSAAESPAAPPEADRPARAMAKIAAGAQVLFVNHCSPEQFAAFAAALADLFPHPEIPGAPAVPLIACVPLLPTRASADRIVRYLHHAPAPELLAALDAPNPIAAAVGLAVAHAERLLEIPGVVGIDLSAPAGPGEGDLVVGALAMAGRALGVGS